MAEATALLIVSFTLQNLLNQSVWGNTKQTSVMKCTVLWEILINSRKNKFVAEDRTVFCFKLASDYETRQSVWPIKTPHWWTFQKVVIHEHSPRSPRKILQHGSGLSFSVWLHLPPQCAVSGFVSEHKSSLPTLLPRSAHCEMFHFFQHCHRNSMNSLAYSWQTSI